MVKEKLTYKLNETNRKKRAREKAPEADIDAETHLFVQSSIP